MSTETNTKRRTMDDSEILDFINDVATKRVKKVRESLNVDDIVSIGYNASQLIECISRIKEYPSKYHIDQFKESTKDKRVLYQLQSPEVALALELKAEYDVGRLDVFDKVLDYQKANGLNIKDDDIVTNFIDNAQYFLPPLPKIEDEEVRDQLESNVALGNYSYMGRRYFESVVSRYLIQRFYDREIKEMAVYATNQKVASEWARLYELTADNKVAPYEVFFAYIGALASQIPYSTNDLESEIKTWVTIILEPILMQFDSSNPLMTNSKDELRSRLGEIEFRNIYVSTNPDPIYLVQIYAGGQLLIGTNSDTSLGEAEAKAATDALYNVSLLKRAEDFIETSNLEKRSSLSVSPYVGDKSLYKNGAPQPHPVVHPVAQVAHPHPSYGFPPPQPQPVTPVNPNVHTTHRVEQPNAIVQASFPGVKTDVAASYPQSLINEDYQRQLQEESASVLEAPPVTDEASIDNSSKEKLNRFLCDRRIAPAEYKTAKLNNSDVQVICFIENRAIAKAISTNKKKAGQIVAQYILNYPEYFLQRFLNKN